MANVKLGTKAVGSIVKIKVNGASKDFIVVQQGNPNTGTYDSSCAGTWLLMKDIYTTSTFGNNNSYKDSSIHSYLNGTFFNLIDADIRNAIKQVKIPYQDGTGSGGSLATGSNGLSTKVFLLSGYEVGWTTSDNGYFPKDGVRLAYFGNSSGGNSKRIAYNGSSAAIWWLRSPNTSGVSGVWYVGTDGSYGNDWCGDSCGVRPAFILPSTLVVSDDGTVSVNTAPTVSTDGAALGKKNAAFAWKYTVRDADGDTLTVTEKLDGKTAEEVFLQDFKVFMCGDIRFGVAQGSYMTRKNLQAAQALLQPYLEEARNKQNVEDIYMLLTDVPKEESVVICNGRYAAEVLTDGFDTQPDADASWTLPGVVSRKKQFIPALMTAYQEL